MEGRFYLKIYLLSIMNFIHCVAGSLVVPFCQNTHLQSQKMWGLWQSHKRNPRSGIWSTAVIGAAEIPCIDCHSEAEAFPCQQLALTFLNQFKVGGLQARGYVSKWIAPGVSLYPCILINMAIVEFTDVRFFFLLLSCPKRFLGNCE